MMLIAGYRWPVREKAYFEPLEKVDMQPWRFAIPCAATLMSCVVGLYLTLSPIGLVDGISAAYAPLMATLIVVNLIVCWRFSRAPTGVA
jgi:SSS family solute:Na+ symporter